MNGFHGKYKGNFRLQPIGSRRWKLATKDVYLRDGYLHEVTAGTETDLASVPYRLIILLVMLANQLLVSRLSEMAALTGDVAWYILLGVWVLWLVYLVLTFPCLNDTARPAIHHDLMYREQVPRREADNHFYHGLRVYVGRFWSTVFWLGVRSFGWVWYCRYRKTANRSVT